MTLTEAYIEKLKTRLQNADAEIARLEQQLKIKKVDAKISQSIAGSITTLREKKAELQNRLNSWQSTASASIGEIQGGLDKAYDELSDALNKAAAKL